MGCLVSEYRMVHTTGYRYDGGATDSFNEARMTPHTSRRQLVLSSRLDITPVAWTNSYRDYWEHLHHRLRDPRAPSG